LCGFEAWQLSVAFCSSLTQLSCEIEGHPMGGGLLKLEPSEAARVLVASECIRHLEYRNFQKLDKLARNASHGSMIDLADELILKKGLGLSWKQIEILRDGLEEMRQARRKKNGEAKGFESVSRR
jgi:hypothetical protein